MKMLIACEESQRVCEAFRNKGHEAYSCDIIDCSGGHPEWHIKQDVIPLLNGNCCFYTCDGVQHNINTKWDMIIAFPPCTDLAVSGASSFEKKRNDGRQEASIKFFCAFFNADCEKIVIENPVNIISGNYCIEHFPKLAKEFLLPKKPTQYIQPYEFGEPTRKKTGLWIKGVNNLIPTNVVEPKLITYINKDGKELTDTLWHFKTGKGTGKIRSKTYQGIANAMADQWG